MSRSVRDYTGSRQTTARHRPLASSPKRRKTLVTCVGAFFFDMEKVLLVLIAACVVCAGAVVTNAPADSLAYAQERGASPSSSIAAGAVDTFSSDSRAESVLSRFVEVPGERMRAKALEMAIKFVADVRATLKVTYPAKGALKAAALATGGDFDKNFRAACKKFAPSTKMCPNFVSIIRVTFAGENPFSRANTERFEDSVTDIILRWVQAWRLQHPKRSSRQRGNPWSAAVRTDATEDPMSDVRLSTAVRGGLNTFGRLNSDAAQPEVGLAAPKGRYPTGTAMEQPNGEKYKSPRHVNELAAQVKADLRYLREKVYAAIKPKKFNRMIGNREKAHRAVRATRRICNAERKNRAFAPTFCRAVEYLASVNFVGRNYFKNLKDFAALTASFMQHNHKQTSRYGYHIMRKPNYSQDVTAATVKLALHVAPSKFNLRSFSREFNNILSNVLGVPRSRIRIASVRFGARKGGSAQRRLWNRRRHVTVTFEFLPKKGDKRIRSRPAEATSVDALAEQFRAMALDRPKSDFYKVPILSRLLPRTLILTKTLGRRPRKVVVAPSNVQSANTPRFAEVSQSLVSEQSESLEAATHDDSEMVELEQSDEEFTDSDSVVDSIESEDEAEEEAEADEEMEEEFESMDEAQAIEEVENAELEELESEEAEATLEAEGEVSLIQIAEQQMQDTATIDIAAETAALHLSTSEAEEEESVPEAFIEAEADAEVDSESDEALETESEDAEVEEIDSYEASLMQQTEQVVADEDEEAADEADADDADESDDEADSEDEADAASDVDADSDVNAASDLSSDAMTAAEPELAALPEVNALPESAETASLIETHSRAADGAVFLQTDLEVKSASVRGAMPTAMLAVALLASLLALAW